MHRMLKKVVSVSSCGALYTYVAAIAFGTVIPKSSTCVENVIYTCRSEASLHVPMYVCMYPWINWEPHLPRQPLGQDVKQSPNAQDTFQPIPGLVSCAEVTESLGITCNVHTYMFKIEWGSLLLFLSECHCYQSLSYKGAWYITQ